VVLGRVKLATIIKFKARVMFTGIVEALGTVIAIRQEGQNIHFVMESPISDQLKVDQSISHDGVCLTVVAVQGQTHTVTAVAETLHRTRVGSWREGTIVNLERSMRLGDRVDGHVVQGHVDAVAKCLSVVEEGGSWRFRFSDPSEDGLLLADKGSVCLNGVSLTVIQPGGGSFEVAIIPYTWAHTNFRYIRAGDPVNIEFDILGKYVNQWMAARFRGAVSKAD
jgi:riboflavin synthase